MSESKSKNIVIVALCITLIFMGVGFSYLSQTLTINGTASVDSDASWDVRIDSITPVAAVYAHASVTGNDLASKFGNGSSTTLNAANDLLGKAYVDTSTNTEATFDVILHEPGDYVVYEVVVGNHGTIDAKLTQTNIDDDDVPDDGGNPALKIFKYSFVTLGAEGYADTTPSTGSLLAAVSGQTVSTETYYVKVEYQDTALTSVPTGNDATGEAEITFDYSQYSANN